MSYERDVYRGNLRTPERGALAPGFGKETLTNPEYYTSAPRILAFMGASGSGKDVALEVLESLPGRRGVAKKLELQQPVNVRIIPKVTDRPPRVVEVSKLPVSEDEFTKLEQSGQLVGKYTLRSNGCRYAYKLDDFTRSCNEEFLLAEPSVLHVLELKEKFSDRMHCTFLASSRQYREKLLNKRGTETKEEIHRRLDEGDGQTYLALLLAGKSSEFINQFVSPEIAGYFQKFLTSDPSTWANDGMLVQLADKVGPDLVDILGNVISHKGVVVDELINIDRFQTFIDDIVILDDKFITDNPFQAGLFSESVIDSATRMLLNSRNRIFSVDQSASSNVICNLLVPESAKSESSIFKVSYKQIFDEVLKNQEHRVFSFETDNPDLHVPAEWFSYYVDREHVFGLVLHDPDHPENMVAFSATKPDEIDEALINFRIQLPVASSPIDRNTAQMSFMVQILRICDALGIKKFHYAEHVDLVDQDDTVIGLIPRALAHESNEYIHRAASVILWRWHYDEEKKQYKKELFMIHRSANKQMNPNVWQAAPSGHLLPGETYAECARRELGEEIGAQIAQTVQTIYPLRQLRVYSDPSTNRTPQKENFYFFIANIDYDASKAVNTNYESDVATWMDVDTVKRMMSEDASQFRDAFRMAFEKVDWDTVPGPAAPKRT